MEFKDFMKDITGTLMEYNIHHASFDVNIDTADGKVNISPHGTKISFGNS